MWVYSVTRVLSGHERAQSPGQGSRAAQLAQVQPSFLRTRDHSGNTESALASG